VVLRVLAVLCLAALDNHGAGLEKGCATPNHGILEEHLFRPISAGYTINEEVTEEAVDGREVVVV
jgi:hypothetical protein